MSCLEIELKALVKSVLRKKKSTLCLTDWLKRRLREWIIESMPPLLLQPKSSEWRTCSIWMDWMANLPRRVRKTSLMHIGRAE